MVRPLKPEASLSGSEALRYLHSPPSTMIRLVWQFHPGTNVGMGKDHTLFAKAEGEVKFSVRGKLSRKKPRRYVEVVATAPQDHTAVHI